MPNSKPKKKEKPKKKKKKKKRLSPLIIFFFTQNCMMFRISCIAIKFGTREMILKVSLCSVSCDEYTNIIYKNCVIIWNSFLNKLQQVCNVSYLYTTVH